MKKKGISPFGMPSAAIRLLSVLTASLPLRAADVDGDGDLQITDVTLLQRYLAEMDVPYPIGDPIAVS